MMMMMMEMEVASYDPAFQTELLFRFRSTEWSQHVPAKLLPGVAPLWRWFSWAWRKRRQQILGSWMVYPGAPLQNLIWKGNIYFLRMICSMVFIDIPLFNKFYSMFPSTIGFSHCQLGVPEGHAIRETRLPRPWLFLPWRFTQRASPSPNKSKQVQTPCPAGDTVHLFQPVHPGRPRQIPMMKWIDFFQFCQWDGRRFFRRLSSQFQNGWEWQWNLECISKQNQSWWLCETNV